MMAGADPLVSLRKISKTFTPGPGVPGIEILRGVDLEIGAGESVAIVGPSGSGKSTLLNILGTLDQPSSGEVWLGGRNLAGLDEATLAAVRNREIGFIFQAHHLLPHCTVWENVLVPTIPQKGQDAVEERALGLLNRVGLRERLQHQPGQLSGGEKQRVAVVRALINRPKLLLADEPTGALDRESASGLGNLLVELNREEGVTLVVVTHALDLARRMQRVLELDQGKLESLSPGNKL